MPDTIIVIGFHHRQSYGNVLFEKGEWETPLGNLIIDDELSHQILSSTEILKSDDNAFLRTDENSVELQMPFIKYCAGERDVKILPIKLSSHNHKELDKIADDISTAIKSLNKDIIVVASSDMSHYNVNNKDQLDTLREIDKHNIKFFLNLEEEKILDADKYIDSNLYDKFNMKRPSVCGTHTIATLILICKKLNANKTKCLKYYNSKDISPGGHAWTVGYFSGIISK